MSTKKDTRKNIGASLILKPSLFILEVEPDSPYYIKKTHKPITICSTCNAKKIDDKCFICNPPF